MIKLIIADDHPLTLAGTKHFVNELGYEVAAICSNGQSALNAINLHEPDLAILDLNMPGLDGLDVLQTIWKKKINVKTVMLTMHSDYSVYEKALEYHVNGFVLKERAQIELKPCLEKVLRGEHYVSAKLDKNLYQKTSHSENEISLSVIDHKIIELVGQNKSTKQIAELLFISEKAVEKHRSRIIETLGLPKEKNSLLLYALGAFKSNKPSNV